MLVGVVVGARGAAGGARMADFTLGVRHLLTHTHSTRRTTTLADDILFYCACVRCASV